jgi:hypothetical protein
MDCWMWTRDATKSCEIPFRFWFLLLRFLRLFLSSVDHEALGRSLDLA